MPHEHWAQPTCSRQVPLSPTVPNPSVTSQLLREQGNQNRRLQEAHLEQERLNLELGHVTRQRRSLQHRQTDQNRAILQLAQQFEKIAGTASQKVSKTRIDPVVKSQLSFLHVICNDLVELLEVEVRHDSLHEDHFVVDHELQALVARLHEENRLPETVSLQHEDADISARTDRRVFLRAVEVGLATMSPLSQGKPMQAGMISYLHAELDDVVQFTFTAFDFTLNDMDANQWFTHFQLHSSEDGRYLGPGLGMLLLKRYAELLGGEVRVSAELNDQISVYLTLPLRINQDDEEEV